MADFQIKRGDTLPSVRAVLTTHDDQGGVIGLDLTDAEIVRFVMRSKDAGAVTVNAAATVVDAVLGVVRYDWKDADTASVGSFQAEWEITWPGSKKQTVPTASYHTIDILADLNNA